MAHRFIAALWLPAALAGIACSGVGRQGGDLSRPPNIVFVLVDDLRWDDIGVAGHPFAQTPNIDQIAREGARLVNAFATTPLCSPSRASFLTGQYAHTNGIIDNTARDAASHRLNTFAVPLERAGYETAFIGKWHMGNDDTPRPGFTHWVAMKGQGEAIDPRLNVDGQRIEKKGYVTDVLTEYATSFMKRSRSKPFMLVLAHKAVHPNVIQQDDGSVVPIQNQASGFVPAERHRGRYANTSVPRRPNALVTPVRKPALQRTIGNLPPLAPSTGTSDADIRARLEMLLAVDESLGQMMETLRQLGELDNTVVIVAGDHGYFYGEHGLNEERRLAYEETIRIPFLIRYPRLVPAGSSPDDFVLSIDLAPTVLEVAGTAPDASIQGKSLLPLLGGKATGWRNSFLVEYYSDTVFPRIRNMGYQAVRTERYKYINYLELSGMDEMYDLELDPFEMDNIIDSPAGLALLPALKAELAKLQQQTGYAARTSRAASSP